MDWYDIAVKIGVGACLGFGVIAMARLAKNKNNRDQKPRGPGDKQPPAERRSDSR